MVRIARTWPGLLLLVGLAGVMATPAAADVACGDVVNQDVTLAATDPVVTTTCPRNGIVIGRDPTQPFTFVILDCAGRTITGAGKGIGIQVRGGVFALISNCIIDGFKTGIQAAGGSSIETSIVLNSVNDGVKLTGEGNVVSGVVSQNNGGAGFNVAGLATEIGEASVASGNRTSGYVVKGKEHVVVDSFAFANGQHGFTGAGTLFDVSGNFASGNAGAGLLFSGGARDRENFFAGNRAITNAGNGLLVTGAHNVDDGGNVGVRNGGPIQCQIAGQPCQP